ncbi:MAG: phosphoribosylamine--glycine ligase [Pontixanthobacter sp.]
MNILLLGSGAREHALAWKLGQSRLLQTNDGRFYAAPGNPGIADHAQCVSLDSADHDAVLDFCRDRDIGMVVVGPEAPLVDGLADSLRAADVPVFGPSKAAAQLEGSKGFTKDLCARADIPTARYIRTASLGDAVHALDAFTAPYVLKADGLAAGKGVVIAQTRAEAAEALTAMFAGAHGDSGTEVVIEEFLEGEEVSLFALTDGTTIVPFGNAQDHKRVGEGDTGPNTGGMGAYSPAAIFTPALERLAMERIVAPTVTAMREAGMPYSGVLFAGLMLTADGPKLIEYNCRFGDPECQVLMMRMKSDLGDIMLACARGELADASPPVFASDTALTVVMAANGYPDAPQKGGTITMKDTHVRGATIFHAGTRLDSQGTLTAQGGRVLSVTGAGVTVAQARTAAYEAVADIDFIGGFYRSDIGWREMARIGTPT